MAVRLRFGIRLPLAHEADGGRGRAQVELPERRMAPIELEPEPHERDRRGRADRGRGDDQEAVGRQAQTPGEPRAGAPTVTSQYTSPAIATAISASSTSATAGTASRSPFDHDGRHDHQHEEDEQRSPRTIEPVRWRFSFGLRPWRPRDPSATSVTCELLDL